MKHLLKVCLWGLVYVGLSSSAWSTEYVIDPAHSSVAFKIRHLFSKVVGSFDSFSGSFSFDSADVTKSQTKIAIETTSVNTKIKKRDDHLRSQDFFYVAKYPHLTFESSKYEVVNASKNPNEPHLAKMTGKLTLRGVTKDIVLDVHYNGIAKDPWGNTAISFEATGKLNRKDFGLTWNKTVETGGFLVGEDVEIEILIEANPKPTQQKKADKPGPAS